MHNHAALQQLHEPRACVASELTRHYGTGISLALCSGYQCDGQLSPISVRQSVQMAVLTIE
jgi:hypothetical protein